MRTEGSELKRDFATEPNFAFEHEPPLPLLHIRIKSGSKELQILARSTTGFPGTAKAHT